MNKKVFVDSLGCPKALVDAERMCYFLQQDKNTIVFHPDEADVIVVNTCAFIETAKKESIDTVLQYAERKKSNPDLKLVITGCLSERYQKEILELIPEIDSAIGVRDPERINEALSRTSTDLIDKGEFNDQRYSAERSLYFSYPHTAYLKISEGCNRSCSFCAIPSIRGKQRSRKIEDILTEARYLTENSVGELVLISEDSISYGMDIYGKRSMIPLLQSLCETDAIWIRLMYLYPESDILDVVRLMNENSKILPYVDMPFQHASKRILTSMQRAGEGSEYLNLIDKIRNTNPEVALRSSFIVGYPGETEEDFIVLRDFILKAHFNRVGFFEYSHEEGTKAFQLKDKVPKKLVRERIKELAAVQESISQENLQKLVGHTLECVNDGQIKSIGGRDYLLARSPYDAPEIDGTVYISNPNEGNLIERDFIKVKIEKRYGSHDMIGCAVIE